MDLLIWAAMLILMAVASYRAARLWRGTTTAFDGWPSEYQRAAPATVWFGTAFFAGRSGARPWQLRPRASRLDRRGARRRRRGLAALILGASLLIGGRPRGLVPPHLRDEHAPRTTRRRRRWR